MAETERVASRLRFMYQYALIDQLVTGCGYSYLVMAIDALTRPKRLLAGGGHTSFGWQYKFLLAGEGNTSFGTERRQYKFRYLGLVAGGGITSFGTLGL